MQALAEASRAAEACGELGAGQSMAWSTILQAQLIPVFGISARNRGENLKRPADSYDDLDFDVGVVKPAVEIWASVTTW